MSKAVESAFTPGYRTFMIAVGVDVKIVHGTFKGWTGKVTVLEPQAGWMHAEVMFPDGSTVTVPTEWLGATEEDVMDNMSTNNTHTVRTIADGDYYFEPRSFESEAMAEAFYSSTLDRIRREDAAGVEITVALIEHATDDVIREHTFPVTH